MLAHGWLDEVRTLMDSGLHRKSQAIRFHRLSRLRAVLRGEMQLDEARAAIQQATRRYAKRQLTWFRREAGVHWVDGFGDDPDVQQQSLAWLREQQLG